MEGLETYTIRAYIHAVPPSSDDMILIKTQEVDIFEVGKIKSGHRLITLPNLEIFREGVKLEISLEFVPKKTNSL